MNVDAIDALLDNPHPLAQQLAARHRANRMFIPAVAAELRWLKATGQKPRGIAAVAGFLRWDRRWKKLGNFAVDENLLALMSRVVMWLYPDIAGMLRTGASDADKVCLGVANIAPPSVPVIHRAPTCHIRITPAERAEAVAALRGIVERSPNPGHPRLVAWSGHFESQPEIFAFTQRILRQRNPDHFSARDLYEYTRDSVRRATQQKRRFTAPNVSRALYCRALVLANPSYNGRTQFENCDTNLLLGLKLAAKPINGEPYRRLLLEAK